MLKKCLLTPELAINIHNVSHCVPLWYSVHHIKNDIKLTKKINKVKIPKNMCICIKKKITNKDRSKAKKCNNKNNIFIFQDSFGFSNDLRPFYK